MTFDQVRRSVVAALHTAAGVQHEERFTARLEDPTQDVSFTEFELDSLSTMEALMEIEENTGVEIDLGDLILHPSVNALASFIVSRCADK